MIEFDEFESMVQEIYDNLPSELREKFSINLEQYPTKGSLNQRSVPYGYWLSLTPETITLCYWVFRLFDDFRKEHIERVIKHEFEHRLMGETGNPEKHSEHK